MTFLPHMKVGGWLVPSHHTGEIPICDRRLLSIGQASDDNWCRFLPGASAYHPPLDRQHKLWNKWQWYWWALDQFDMLTPKDRTHRLRSSLNLHTVFTRNMRRKHETHFVLSQSTWDLIQDRAISTSTIRWFWKRVTSINYQTNNFPFKGVMDGHFNVTWGSH